MDNITPICVLDANGEVEIWDNVPSKELDEAFCEAFDAYFGSDYQD